MAPRGCGARSAPPRARSPMPSDRATVEERREPLPNAARCLALGREPPTSRGAVSPRGPRVSLGGSLQDPFGGGAGGHGRSAPVVGPAAEEFLAVSVHVGRAPEEIA